MPMRYPRSKTIGSALSDCDSDSNEELDSSDDSGLGDSDSDEQKEEADNGEKVSASTAASEQAGTGFKAEEVTRLHDELVALKMHNEELLHMRQQLLKRKNSVEQSRVAASGDAAAGAASSSSAAAPKASGFSLGRSLASKVTANVGAGATAVRRRSSLLGNKDPGELLSPDLARRNSDPAIPGNGVVSEATDVAVLQIEAESLRRQIRVLMDEVSEADAAAAAKKTSGNSGSAALPSWLPKPEVIRQKVMESRPQSKGSDDGLVDDVGFVDDHLLQRVAYATVELAMISAASNSQAPKKSPRKAAAAPEAPREAPAKEAEGDADWILLQRKIEAQQEELDRLLEIQKRGSQDITRLRDQIDTAAGTRRRSSLGKEEKNQAKVKLRETALHLESLTRQVQDAEEAKESAQLLLSQLKNSLEQASELGRVSGEMQKSTEQQTEESRLLRDRLHLLQEDLYGQVERRRKASAWQRLRRRPHVSSAATAVIPEDALHTVPASSSSDRAVAAPANLPACRGETTEPLKGTAEASPAAAPSLEIGVQAALAPGSLQAILECQRLRTEMDDMRIEKALLVKRMGRDLQSLRDLLRSTEQSTVPEAKSPEKTESLSEEPDLDTPETEKGSPVKTNEIFLVDNRFLQASTPGLGFRNSPSLTDMDKDRTLVKWGSKVCGVLLEDAEVPDAEAPDVTAGGWLRVGHRFLPMHLEGIPVLRVCGGEGRRICYHDISSDCASSPRKGSDSDGEDSTPPEPYPAGLLYVQRIEELEQLGDWLRRDLSEIHERERALRAENKEKNELIMHLMHKAKLTELPTSEVSANGTPFWRRDERADGSLEDLERVIEETTQENIGLRNDMQVMAGKLRKALAAADGASVASNRH